MTRSPAAGFELDRLKRVIEGIRRAGELTATKTLIVLGSARAPALPAPTLSRRLKPAAVAIQTQIDGEGRGSVLPTDIRQHSGPMAGRRWGVRFGSAMAGRCLRSLGGWIGRGGA